MAKTKPQTDEPRETEGATSTAKKAKRPSKKQATKKTAKKPAKKTSARSSTPRVSKKRSSKKPAKKQPSKKTAKKQSAKKPAQKAKKPAKKAEMPAAQEERTVISSPPSRQRGEKEKTAVDRDQKAVEAAQTPQETPENVQTEEMQWGRRTRRSAPIGWEDRAGVSTPVQPARQQDANTEEKTAQAPPQARTETSAQSTRNEPKKEDTRKVSRPHSGRNQSNQNKQRPSKRTSDRSRSQEKKPAQQSRLTQILAQSWTEDKTRQFISEGFLGSLSPELVNNGNSESIPDAERLKKPLEMIRKVLADECMVADDVTDLMLLDVVMNALSDRIDVCRLQAQSNALSDIDAILELRYKADRRLIEAVNALKNA